MATASAILNDLLDYLARSKTERVPDFDPHSLSNTVREIVEYLEKQARDVPPLERAEDADAESAAPGVLAIGGNLVGRKTAKGWLLTTTEPVEEAEVLLDEDEGFWGELTGVVPYTFKEKVRADATTWADLTGGRTGTCYEANDVAGIAVGTIIKIRVEYDSTGTLRYVFNVSSANEVEGGTVPSAVIPAKDKGWIYKYTRAGVVEDAHADPRTETMYVPTSICSFTPAIDARGHIFGWWYASAGWQWESPWGFSDPGKP